MVPKQGVFVGHWVLGHVLINCFWVAPLALVGFHLMMATTWSLYRCKEVGRSLQAYTAGLDLFSFIGFYCT